MMNNLSSFASVFFFETTYGVDWWWTGGGWGLVHLSLYAQTDVKTVCSPPAIHYRSQQQKEKKRKEKKKKGKRDRRRRHCRRFSPLPQDRREYFKPYTNISMIIDGSRPT